MLLEQSYRVDAEEKLELISVVSVPHMKDNGGKEVIEAYEKQAIGIENHLLDPRPEPMAKEKLKVLFNR